MKAIQYYRYGPPEVLQLKEVEKPTPKKGEILVKVHAASVNPLDWHGMRGAPFIARVSGGWTKPKDPRLGADFAGQVEAFGAGVTKFHPGDEVFGMCGSSFAEYATAKQDRTALKPSNKSFEEAAAVPVAGITALQGLRDYGKIKAGQKVLVNGASGGVGSFAVQIAKSYGTEVTGVCSTKNLKLVSSIGADHVIDYTKQDFTRTGQSYDLIYDAVGNHSVSDCKRALNPQGICAVAGFGGLSHLFALIVLGPLSSSMGNKKVGMMGLAKPNTEDLVYLKELIEAGKVSPVIDRRFERDCRSHPVSRTGACTGKGRNHGIAYSVNSDAAGHLLGWMRQTKADRGSTSGCRYSS